MCNFVTEDSNQSKFSSSTTLRLEEPYISYNSMLALHYVTHAITINAGNDSTT
jgi:hypothetical protein